MQQIKVVGAKQKFVIWISNFSTIMVVVGENVVYSLFIYMLKFISFR